VTKNTVSVVSVPLNPNELLLPSQCVCVCVCLCVSSSDYRHTLKISKTFMFKPESDNDGESQEEVARCRMQIDISEWLIDEFILLKWS